MFTDPSLRCTATDISTPEIYIPPAAQVKWLKQVLGPYPQKDQIYNDVDATLAAYPTLRPKNDVYTFNDGRAQLLLCVHGLIPITFRQATYNIPIAIWLPLEYPRLPPLVYVVPTSEMLVKSSKNVDPSGECTFDYLDNWRRKSEGCNLRALIEVMQENFSREPPVYAKPKNTAPSTPPPAIRAASPAGGPLPPRPPPPLPSTSSQPPPSHQQLPNVTSQPFVGSHGPGSPPPRPPKIFSPAIQPNPTSTSGNVSPIRPPPLPASPLRNQAPPFRPAFALSQPGPPPPAPPPPGPHTYQQTHNRSNSLASQTGSGNYLPPPQTQSSPNAGNRWSMPSQPGTTHSPMQPPPPTQHQPPPPPPPAAYQQHSNPQAPLAAPAPTPIISVPTPPVPPAPRPNFLDEDDASAQVNEAPPSPNAPPRPMNPELLRLHHDLHAKITTELSSLSNALAGDNERLRATQGDLLAGEPAIRDEMARLEAVRSVCTTVGDRLQDVVTRAEANVHHLKSKGDPEVDELVCSTAIVYNH
ncbi:Tumor susceptibility gene 101 protein AltName: Full=ESCRT-I complex subunit TSG101 [Rhizoctonia solani AG-1 IB]|uniref:Rhizoctonia solani AG1-IB WGS project CAOJ00000000 data, isolate 7/3/14, contig 04141 n=1 Tax=Thanatephorus cucumeris (strain AG1-IB / isolate 7/3/14) TaxID=1108050 RepID=M5BMC2_THACB|nr:Tumor susceptibility gene 101 protein AltName: Full=ESCRT-I complex subunit TSG101 [Rhizoctonia solani AG-1 IB]